MAKRFIAPLIMRVASWVDADRVVRNLDRRIRELVDTPIVNGTSILDIELPDGEEVAIAHGLNRRATALVSQPQDATTTGRIIEVRSSSYDQKRYVVLKATGFGATVTVDIWAF